MNCIQYSTLHSTLHTVCTAHNRQYTYTFNHFTTHHPVEYMVVCTVCTPSTPLILIQQINHQHSNHRLNSTRVRNQIDSSEKPKTTKPSSQKKKAKSPLEKDDTREGCMEYGVLTAANNPTNPTSSHPPANATLLAAKARCCLKKRTAPRHTVTMEAQVSAAARGTA